MRPNQFWTYILTNANKTVLYTGITNNLAARLVEHWIGKEGCFTTKYHVYYLVWSKETKYVLNAIDLEKEIKDWTRVAKEYLIKDANPNWIFRNEEVLGNWPPTPEQIAHVKERWRMERELKADDRLSFHKQMLLIKQGY